MKDLVASTIALLTAVTIASPIRAQLICPGLIENGDFSAGNQGFFSHYAQGCNDEQQYEIVRDANTCNQSWHGLDHTTGSGYFMVVNGAMIPDQVVWRQTVPVTPQTNYKLSAWITSVYPEHPATLRFLINGHQSGSLAAPPVFGSWIEFSVEWNSGQDLSATISIVDETLEFSGNDFGVDDICFLKLEPVSVETVTWGSIKAVYR